MRHAGSFYLFPPISCFPSLRRICFLSPCAYRSSARCQAVSLSRFKEQPRRNVH
jgi:hypothetical protein